MITSSTLQCCPTLAPLAAFTRVTELQLHGSHWAEAGLHSLLAAMGPRLLSLGLVAVKGLGLASLHHILSCCRQLATIVFNSCDFDGPEAELELGAAVPEVDTLEELVITSSARCGHHRYS